MYVLVVSDIHEATAEHGQSGHETSGHTATSFRGITFEVTDTIPARVTAALPPRQRFSGLFYVAVLFLQSCHSGRSVVRVVS